MTQTGTKTPFGRLNFKLIKGDIMRDKNLDKELIDLFLEFLEKKTN